MRWKVGGGGGLRVLRVCPPFFGTLARIYNSRNIRTSKRVVEGHIEAPAHGRAGRKMDYGRRLLALVCRGSRYIRVGVLVLVLVLVLMLMLGVAIMMLLMLLMTIDAKLHIPAVTHAAGEVCEFLHGLREES